jgi:hypothetical protein
MFEHGGSEKRMVTGGDEDRKALRPAMAASAEAGAESSGSTATTNFEDRPSALANGAPCSIDKS